MCARSDSICTAQRQRPAQIAAHTITFPHIMRPTLRAFYLPYPSGTTSLEHAALLFSTMTRGRGNLRFADI